MELFIRYPLQVQEETLNKLLSEARFTEFGWKHGFKDVRNASQFKERVPIQSYEALKPYIDRQLQGENDLLWPGEVKWFAKSSGTTSSKSKFIPVTSKSLEDCHFKGGKDMLSIYCHNNPDTQLFTGKGLSVGGSNSINRFNQGSYYGDLSAVLMQNLPLWAEYHRTPDLEIALMAEWEQKIQRIVEQTKDIDVTSMTGVPSWTMVLCKHLLAETGKESLLEVWPNLEVFFHGGVSFQPYKDAFLSLIGGSGIHFLETYNASEGFFGIQDRSDSNEMLLMLDYGVYYEFIPVEEVGSNDPKVVALQDVQVGKNYAIVISTNGGLWRYLIGDTIKFTSTDPFRILITGRVKSFINAFGEELIVQNAELAMRKTCEATGARVTDYTAAPKFIQGSEKGLHQWLVEFSSYPEFDLDFADILDNELMKLNSDYEAKRHRGLLLQAPEIIVAPPGTFNEWLASQGKLGGQHKVPRLSNNRDILESILPIVGKLA